MDDLGEKRSYPSLEERKEAASRAMDEMEEAIEQANNQVSEDEARQLGTNYINYLMESRLHAQDEVSEQTVRFSTGEGESLASFRREEESQRAARMGAEQALIAAGNGDYVAVKNLVNKKGDAMLTIPSTEDHGKKLKLVASKMPIKGVPFKPPLPAWQDPKFSARK